MSVFTQKLNALTGKLDWIMQSDNYDYMQEVARSAYADMLHDKERNDKYYEGLKLSIKELRRQGKEVHVLDIGTGTGLLSMMAVSCEADSVTACEAFSPMSECAKQVLKCNKMENKIKLICKRSTEIECGEGKDMPRRANLLVTEVFDTELIGEGAIETFQHANKHLLTDDALIVPSKGTIYAQVVSSDILLQWNKIFPIHFEASNGKQTLEIPKAMEECHSSAVVHDLQLSEVPQDWFNVVSEPLPVFRYDWSGRTIPLKKNQTTKTHFKSKEDGNALVILMWWDLIMDQEGTVLLSCAPHWAHPFVAAGAESSSSDIPWRDHWMQAVYYLPQSLSVYRGESLSLISSHDEYSLWFDLTNNDSDSLTIARPVLHSTTSRTRIGKLNDPRGRDFFLRVLSHHVSPETVCLALGEFNIMALMAAKIGAHHVYLHESEVSKQKLLKEYILQNNLTHKVTILTSELSEIEVNQLVAPVTLVFSEPFFETSLLPWHSLLHYYQRLSAGHLLAPNAIVLPDALSVRGMPVSFRDLWKIRAPLKHYSGFDLSVFDRLIDNACAETDENVEPQPLWEYPAVALAAPRTLLNVDLDRDLPTCDLSQASAFKVKSVDEGPLNGVALWADWHFGTEDVFTTGPIKEVIIGKKVVWDAYTRQGVHLLRNPCSEQLGETLNIKTVFEPDQGSVHFDFDVKRC